MQEILDLHGTELERLVERLAHFAACKMNALKWRGARLRRGGSVPGAYEAPDFVHDAFAKALDGTRNWNREAYPTLEAFLRSVVKSDISAAVTAAENQDRRYDSASSSENSPVRTATAGLIRVSTDIREPGRRRFAIAHELGHWVLHKNASHLLACTEGDLIASYKTSPLEVEASVFAASLLMPEHLFGPLVRKRPPTADCLKVLAERFGVSLTAAALRYVETSDDYCALVVSEQGRVRWWRASHAFGDRELWIESRSKVPPPSVAATYFDREVVEQRPQRVELKAWFGDLPGVFSEEVIEQGIPLPAYGQLLSLLWLP